jgi:hypothetical protein
MTRSTLATLGALILTTGCAAATSPTESRDRAEWACNDQSGMGYTGRLQFNRCMTPRGYAVRSGD